jgi:hypothetical protein
VGADLKLKTQATEVNTGIQLILAEDYLLSVMVSRVEFDGGPKMVVSIFKQFTVGVANNQSFESTPLLPADILDNTSSDIFDPSNIQFKVSLGNLSADVPGPQLHFLKFYSKYMLVVDGPWMGYLNKTPCTGQLNGTGCRAFNLVGETCLTCISGAEHGTIQLGGNGMISTCEALPFDTDYGLLATGSLQKVCSLIGNFIDSDICKPCDETCESCVGELATDCSACPAGFELLDGLNPAACIPVTSGVTLGF